MMGIFDTLTKSGDTTPPQESQPEEPLPKSPGTDANINEHQPLFLPFAHQPCARETVIAREVA
jgi:hypothetical protein